MRKSGIKRQVSLKVGLVKIRGRLSAAFSRSDCPDLSSYYYKYHGFSITYFLDDLECDEKT